MNNNKETKIWSSLKSSSTNQSESFHNHYIRPRTNEKPVAFSIRIYICVYKQMKNQPKPVNKLILSLLRCLRLNTFVWWLIWLNRPRYKHTFLQHMAKRRLIYLDTYIHLLPPRLFLYLSYASGQPLISFYFIFGFVDILFNSLQVIESATSKCVFLLLTVSIWVSLHIVNGVWCYCVKGNPTLTITVLFQFCSSLLKKNSLKFCTV